MPSNTLLISTSPVAKLFEARRHERPEIRLSLIIEDCCKVSRSMNNCGSELAWNYKTVFSSPYFASQRVHVCHVNFRDSFQSLLPLLTHRLSF
jgi:hypothetical protein